MRIWGISQVTGTGMVLCSLGKTVFSGKDCVLALYQTCAMGV